MLCCAVLQELVTKFEAHMDRQLEQREEAVEGAGEVQGERVY